MDLNPQSIFDRAAGIPVNAAQLAALSDGLVDAPRLSRIRNGAAIFDHKELAVLDALLRELELLKYRAGKVPINWQNVGAVKVLLGDLRLEKKSPPAPLSSTDADILHKFAAGADIDHLAIDARMSKVEFLSYVEDLLVRSTRLASLAKQQHVAA